MRNLHELDQYRITNAAMLVHTNGWAGDNTCGAFGIPSPIDGQIMRVLASANQSWDHVSVSRRNRVPNWAEMSHIHRMFFRADEVAMQLHMPPDQHINEHSFVLHLWRPHDVAIPLPPRIFV